MSVYCCWKALQGLIQGAGQAYQPYFNEEVRQQLWQCLYHPNRFVRETGYETSGNLCAIFAGTPLQLWGKELALKLQDGLSENWSQVLLYSAELVTTSSCSCLLGPSLACTLTTCKLQVTEAFPAWVCTTWCSCGLQQRHQLGRLLTT